ncbi:exported hypothetical protein [Candidatus Sulfopaludibacter sp. SbA4]|nr:exported hypothetical protein [Candidatus Sulfopaludibacter sp. SbA4]
MSLTRREVLKGGLAAVAGAAVAGAPAAGARTPYFGLHPFIDHNPKAVFIRRTHVAHKMDADAKRAEGLRLSQAVFVPRSEPGIPISHRIVLKPNATSLEPVRRPAEENWGTGTDPQFYEGLVLGLKQLGLTRFTFIDSTSYASWNLRGLLDINERLGVTTQDPERRIKHLREGWETNWSTVPDGVVFRRIPHYAPVNEPDTWLLNIAKWKGHSMGLTLTVKNEQGLVTHPFTNFCGGWRAVLNVSDDVKPDINPNVESLVNAALERHRKLGYSRYETGGSRANGAFLRPIEQEIWAQKTCDNMSTLKTGLAMIEGIYGRDGDGFQVGDDYLTNVVLFGKDKFRVDVIGLWLGGHEPGNVHLYRIAKERGLSDTFCPWDIPVYEWTDDGPVARRLTDFERTPLRTVYLPKDGEPALHLLDEPFDYDRYKV